MNLVRPLECPKTFLMHPWSICDIIRNHRNYFPWILLDFRHSVRTYNTYGTIRVYFGPAEQQIEPTSKQMSLGYIIDT